MLWPSRRQAILPRSRAMRTRLLRISTASLGHIPRGMNLRPGRYWNPYGRTGLRLLHGLVRRIGAGRKCGVESPRHGLAVGRGDRRIEFEDAVVGGERWG